MKPLTLEWIEKAKEDFTMLEREMRARKSPSYNGICFHAQQCAEKYLKARLQEASSPFPKTHNLLDLLRIVTPIEPLWSAMAIELTLLDRYAVRYRYPGESADRGEALDARKACRAVRNTVRVSLGLGP